MNRKRIKDQNSHPTIGLHQDIVKFVEEFINRCSFRFKDFSTLWKEWRFEQITYGRYTENALKDFMQCLYHQLVIFSQSIHSRGTQVCSVYLMYAFYLKQPQHFQLFFQLTMKEFDVLMGLCDYLCKEGHLDCVYIMKRLFDSSAFRLCATIQPYYPGVPKYSCSEDIIDSLDIGDSTDLNSTYATRLLDHENVKKLSDVHKIYNKMKDDYSLFQSGEIPHSLRVVPEDTVDKLQNLITTPVEKPLDISIPLNLPGQNTTSNTTVDKEEEVCKGQAYADRRQVLKSSAFVKTSKPNWRAKQSARIASTSQSSSDSNNYDDILE